MVMYDNNMIMSLKQKKRKFEPSIKLNHNIFTLGTLTYNVVLVKRYFKVTTETKKKQCKPEN